MGIFCCSAHVAVEAFAGGGAPKAVEEMNGK